jgi:hypothetical protein
MQNYQYIFIGIDRYHFLAPLTHAVTDASRLYQFFLEEAKFSPRQALLLTDTSSDRDRPSTYPDRYNILNWLPSEIKKPFWFFFSGYALDYDGEVYLLPSDGNPNDISKTGISLRSLFELFPGRQAIFILDLKSATTQRSSIVKSAIALSKKMKISLILSSHSQGGTFVTAILEALRCYRQKITLAKLEQYLRDRLSIARAIDSPVVISPSPEANHLPLLRFERIHSQVNLPPINKRDLVRQEDLSFPTEGDRPLATISSYARSSDTGFPSLPYHRSPLFVYLPRGDRESVDLPKLPARPQSYPSLNLDLPRAVRKPHRQSSLLKKIARWRWFLAGFGCSLIPALLIASLLLDRLDVRLPQPIADRYSQPAEEDVLNRARILLGANQASDFNRAIARARQLQPGMPFYQEAQADIDRWSKIILDIAEGRARMGDFRGAIAAAELVPRDRATFSATATHKIHRWQQLQQQQQMNRALIQTARMSIDPKRVITYNRAIAIVRQIPSTQPDYLEARKFMNKWSQRIYFRALSQAAEGEIGQAVETAKLIPADTPLYNDANKAIARWQQEYSRKY